MLKPVFRRLLPLLLAVGWFLLPSATAGYSLQRIFEPPLPLPQEPQAPAGSRPAHATPSHLKPDHPADQLAGQVFREGALQESDAFNPTEAIHDIEVGHFYLVQGDYPGALSRFQEALRHDPGASEAMYEAGEVEMKLRQPDHARDFFQRYMETAPQGKHAPKVQSILKKLNHAATHR